MSKIIGLRAGHIGASSSTGASANGLIERDINQDVFTYVYNKLTNTYGFKVYYKTGDLGSTVYDYYNKYLTSNSYLLLPIHHDGLANTSVNGSMVLASVFASDNGLKHAKLLLNYFCSAFGSANRGILQKKNSEGKDYYGIIRNTKATVLLGEALVLTNTENANYIKNNYDNYIKLQGECYIKTACSWYGVTYIAEEEQTIDSNYEDLVKDIDGLTADVKSLTSRVTSLEEFNNKLVESIENLTK